jgi:hypothetical protein
MSKELTKPPVIQPEVSAPPLLEDMRFNAKKVARFTYIPGEGLYAGTEKTWYKNTADSPIWQRLRTTPKLSQWLTNNPLAVVYAQYEDGLKVHAVFMGGQWLTRDTGISMTPGLNWVDVPKVAAVVA